MNKEMMMKYAKIAGNFVLEALMNAGKDEMLKKVKFEIKEEKKTTMSSIVYEEFLQVLEKQTNERAIKEGRELKSNLYKELLKEEQGWWSSKDRVLKDMADYIGKYGK